MIKKITVKYKVDGYFKKYTKISVIWWYLYVLQASKLKSSFTFEFEKNNDIIKPYSCTIIKVKSWIPE